MRLGYAWAKGPFGLADTVGAAASGGALPRRPAALCPTLLAPSGGGRRLLPRPRLRPRHRRDAALPHACRGRRHGRRRRARELGLLAENDSAALVDLGDGVACLALRTKMNTCDSGVIDMVERGDPAGHGRCLPGAGDRLRPPARLLRGRRSRHVRQPPRRRRPRRPARLRAPRPAGVRGAAPRAVPGRGCCPRVRPGRRQRADARRPPHRRARRAEGRLPRADRRAHPVLGRRDAGSRPRHVGRRTRSGRVGFRRRLQL